MYYNKCLICVKISQSLQKVVKQFGDKPVDTYRET